MSPTNRTNPREVDITKHTNIDRFRIYSGTTFADLYEVFPPRKKLDAGELVNHCNIVTDQHGREAHELIVTETWRWLKEMDYLRYDGSSGTYDLTPRSFEGLSFWDNPSDSVCRGEKLRQLTQKTGVETLSETIAEIVTKVLGSGARSALAFLA